jgi:hypothetical protein
VRVRLARVSAPTQHRILRMQVKPQEHQHLLDWATFIREAKADR